MIPCELSLIQIYRELYGFLASVDSNYGIGYIENVELNKQHAMDIQQRITDLKTNYGEQLAEILRDHHNTMFIADEIQDLVLFSNLDENLTDMEAMEIATELKRQCGYTEDQL